MDLSCDKCNYPHVGLSQQCLKTGLSGISFESLAELGTEAMEIRARQHLIRYGIGVEDKAAYDAETNTLTLFQGNKVLVQLRALQIGEYFIQDGGTWRWGWADRENTVTDSVTQTVEKEASNGKSTESLGNSKLGSPNPCTEKEREITDRFRNFGAKRGWQSFTTPEIDCSYRFAQKLTAIAMVLSRAHGVYEVFDVSGRSSFLVYSLAGMKHRYQ